MNNKFISIIEKWSKSKGYRSEKVLINIFLTIIYKLGNNNYLYDKEWEKEYEKDINIFMSKFNQKELNDIATFYSEKTVNQKETGSFYTPKDVVHHIIKGISNKNNKNNPKIIDPTAGSGAFLEGVLNKWKLFYSSPLDVLKNIYANDLNAFSLKVWKQKLWIWCIKNNINLKIAKEFIEKNTTLADAVNIKGEYDILIGNPPYFEVKKSEGFLYGNIYAEILISLIEKNSNTNSIFGFIVPISFQTTKRMDKVRNKFLEKYNSYVISSFADRPSCIFPGIHQKLNIIQFWNQEKPIKKTTSYLQFNSQERKGLFKNIKYTNNKNVNLMLGNKIEKSIFKKITKNDSKKYIFNGNCSVFVSQRITHWSKAFPNKQTSNEYVPFKCKRKEHATSMAALLSSDIYFFYWAVISDGWHNTKGVLEQFYIPTSSLKDKLILNKSKDLFNSLEKNKKEINTKQSKYSYIHRKSDLIIRELDKMFGEYYGFTEEELKYIQNYLKEIR